MRILTLNLLAAALLLFGATSASAFAVSMNATSPTSSLTVSDTVTVDVFLDATDGITIFSVAVINTNPAALLYDGPSSNSVSYILYMGGKPATYLVPLQTPYFLTFPPEFPGTEQVNINYVEVGFNQTTATGLGVYVATLVFHVVADFTTESLYLAFTSSNLIQQGTIVVPSGTIGLSAPIILSGHAVPEPTTAMLIGLGIVGLGLAGRRRA